MTFRDRSVLCYLQNQLAKVFAVKQFEQCLREIFNALHHVFLALHRASSQVARHFGYGQVVTVSVIEHTMPSIRARLTSNDK